MNNTVYKELQKENNKPYDELVSIKEKLDKGYYDLDIAGLSTVVQSVGPKRTALYKEDEHGNVIDYWGNSMWDTGVASYGENLSDTRANNQPWIAKIGAALGKGAVLTATTFIDGTVGLLTGLGTGIYNTLDDDPNTGFLQGLWDNEVSKAMHAVNEWSEKAMPNYYTQDEIENPLALRNIFSVNTIFDGLIKNLGFAVGAAYSGGLFTKALSITKLPQLLSKISPGVSTATGAFLGGVFSAVGEANHEALAGADAFYKTNKGYLDAQHLTNLQALDAYKGTEMYETLVFNENEAYNESLKKLEQDRVKVGNADMLANTALLSLSNIFTFGKFFARGFNTSKKGFNAAIKEGLYTTNKSKAKGIALGAAVPFVEGSEELAQKAISNITDLHYTKDVNNFYQAKLNGESEQETVDWLNSLSEGIAQTVNDSSSWQEFLLGAVTGAMGIPTFRSFRKADGSLQSPIKLVGGSREKYKDYMEQMRQEQEVTNYMNERMQSPEFMNYYQGIIRHNKYQKDMDNALENNDVFNFKTAEHAQLISDITMFDRAGKLNDFIATIDNFYNTSYSNLAVLAELYNKNRSSEDKINLDTSLSKKDFIRQLNKDKNDLHKSIEDYKKIKKDIDIQLGDRINEEQLSELTYIQSQINDWVSRRNDLVSTVRKTVDKLKGNIDPKSSLNILLQSKSNKEFVENLQGRISQRLLEAIDNNAESFSQTDITNITNFIQDSVLINQGINTYNAKLKEYFNAPEKLQEDMNTAEQEVKKKRETDKTKSFSDRLKEATTIQEFRTILEDPNEDDSIKDYALATMDIKDSPVYKEYITITNTSNEINKILDSIEAEGESVALAKEAFNALSDIVKNSEDLTNKEILEEVINSTEYDNTTKQEAIYHINNAIDKIKSNKDFNSSFSKPIVVDTLGEEENTEENSVEEKEVKEKEEKKEVIQESSIQTPVGDINETKLVSEGRELERELEQKYGTEETIKKGELKQYYKPGLPLFSKNLIPFPEDPSIRVKGDFTKLYNYLVNKDAFKYIDDLKLKKGDTISFVIDPAFEEEVSGETWHKEPVIFMAHEVDNNVQIVGDLNSNWWEFRGLKELRERIIEEYNNRENKEGLFKSTLSTKVSKMMVGNVLYQEKQTDLYDLLDTDPNNVDDKTSDFHFGICVNDNIVTGSGSLGEFITPLIRTEGRLYLYVKNVRGSYTPIPVRVKHFNQEEYDINNSELADFPMMQDIIKNIKALINITPDNLKDLKDALAKDIYLGTISMFYEDGNLTFKNNNGEKQIVRIKKGNPELEQMTFDEIVEALQSFNLPLQVNKNNIGDKGYQQRILNSHILSTNISSATIQGNWFTTNYYDPNDGTFKEAVSPKSVTYTPLKKETPIGGIESPTPITFRFTDKTYYVKTSSPAQIIDINGHNVPIDASNAILITLAQLQEQYGYKTEGVDIIDNMAIISREDNIVIDRITQTYCSPQEAADVIKRIQERNAGKTLQDSTQLNETDIAFTALIEDQAKISKEGNYYKERVTDNESYIKEGEIYQSVNSILKPNLIKDESIEQQIAVLRKELFDTQSKASQGEEHFIMNLIDKIDDEYFNRQIGAPRLIAQKNIRNPEIVDYYLSYVRDKLYGIEPLESATTMYEINDTVNQYLKNGYKVQPAMMTDKAFDTLMYALDDINSGIKSRNETPYTNVTVSHKYNNGQKIAGEIDILAKTDDGKLHIYAIKTFKGKESLNTFNEKKNFMHMSDLEYTTLQLSAYKNLLESEYGLEVSGLDVIPLVIEVDNTPNTEKPITEVLLYQDIHITPTTATIVPLEIKENNTTDITAPQTIEESIPNVVESITDKEVSNILSTESSLSSDVEGEDIDGSIASLTKEFLPRKVVKDNTKIMNKEQELAWLEKVLPQLSKEDRIKFVKGLIKGTKGVLAWGAFDGSMITLSDIAAEGTLYHEAFHVVFHTLLDNIERTALLKEYQSKNPNKDNRELEELMAEDFREFVLQGGKDTRRLGRKILDFFKSLFIKTKYWGDFRPSSIYYFNAVHKGKYSDKTIKDVELNPLNKAEEYTEEMKNILANASRNKEGKLLAPNGNISNLDERQYAHVRTKAFKEWFGDWELLAKQDVLMPIGTSGSGKSTWIKSLPNLDNYVIISPDEMRVEFTGDMNNKSKDDEIYQEAAKRAVEAIKKGKKVIFDTTNLKKDRRTAFTDAIYGEIPNAKIAYKLMPLNAELAKQRIKDDIESGKNRANVSPETIDRHAASYPKMLEDIKLEKPIVIETNDVSKVVDENNEPSIMWHSSPNDIKNDTFLNTEEITINIDREWITDKNIYDYKKEGYVVSEENIKDYNNGKDVILKRFNGIYTSSERSVSNSYAPMEYEMFEQFDMETQDNEEFRAASWALEESGIYDIMLEKAKDIIDDDYKPYKIGYDSYQNKLKEIAKKLTDEEMNKRHPEGKKEYIFPTNPYNLSNNIVGSELSLFVSLKNALIIDGNESNWDNIDYNGKTWSTRDLEKYARDNGYDGVIIKNIYDVGGYRKHDSFVISNIVAVFDPNQIKSATDNIGEYSNYNNDIRYRDISNEELSAIIDKDFKAAKRIVQRLNYNQYLTAHEAMEAFYKSNINPEYFYRLTKYSPNNATGYKIQLLTVKQYKEYKDLVLEENEFRRESWLFSSLDPDIQNALLNKGWTIEEFNSMTQSERDHAIKCIAF